MTLHIVVKGEGYPLVLFHGWGFNTEIWSSLVPLLSPHYQLHLVDLPGFGSSSTMDWACFKNILSRQLPSQFAVLGWSMGGLFATRLALEDSRVTHLINVASSPRFMKEEQWPGVNKAVFDLFYQNLTLDPQTTLQEFITLQLQRPAASIQLGKAPSLEGLKAGLDVLSNWDLRHLLVKLTKPAMYMFGRLDSIIPQRTLKAMESHYPDFNYHLFPRAAHAPFLSHTHEFVAILKDFLS